MTGGRYWTVLQVMPSVREEIAATMLARAGFEAFVPMERVVRRKGRRGRPVRAEALGPLFPGYVFARIGAGELGRVCALRTVPLPLADAAMPGRRCFAGALGTAGAPGRVPEAEIASLRAAVTVEGCDTLHAARFGAGDRVTLSDEARLPGGAGRVLRVEGRMLTVLAALFGREVELTLPARQCRAADVV